MMNGMEWDSRILELGIDGRRIHVPYIQARILTLLLEKQDRYITALALGAALYNYAPDGKTTEVARVRPLVAALRRTLSGTSLSIHNKYGAGYRAVRATE